VNARPRSFYAQNVNLTFKFFQMVDFLALEFVILEENCVVRG